MSKRIVYKGIAASSGKVYGKTLKLITSNYIILEKKIEKEEIDSEVQKFLDAVLKTKDEFLEIISRETKDLIDDIKDILIAQSLMLEDPMLIEDVIKRIKEDRENAHLALFNVINKITNHLIKQENEYLRDRAIDIKDIGKRIENNLLNKKKNLEILSHLNEEVVIIATELSPTQMLHLDKKKVKGIATELGGKTGHMAILAKNYEIPTVVGIADLIKNIDENEYILIDADNGVVVKNPTLHQIQYVGARSEFPKDKFEVDNTYPITKDGHTIQIKVNLDDENEIENVARMNHDGIGLFRSESLFLQHPEYDPSEEEQFIVYKKLAETLGTKPITIRTFDLGADKFETEYKEANPFLGNRGIRYSLNNKEWFKKQLRAILRASAYGKISMMIPMVTGLTEVHATKELLNECKWELKKNKQKFESIPFGIMVETPATVISIDSFTKECDFLSIGTNDLLQYTVAVDRNNPNISELYNPFHPAFLKLLIMTLQSGKRYNIPVSICGEIASDVNLTIFLIGLGFRELSVSLPLVKKIKKIINAITISQAEFLSRHVIKLSEDEKYSEIESYLFNKHLI